jgi:periplasmic divalent cation tolerance protein
LPKHWPSKGAGRKKNNDAKEVIPVSIYLVLSTAGSLKEGEKIAQHLIRKGLAACVNVVPRLSSYFFWEKRLCREREVLLLIKTVKGQLKRIIKDIKILHSYSVPEILFFRVEGGEGQYLSWVEKRAGKKIKKNIDNNALKS